MRPLIHGATYFARLHEELSALQIGDRVWFTDWRGDGGEVLLDQRVRLFGCHRQKLFVIRNRNDPSRDVAFVGGIDLSHSRRDDADHMGDQQRVDMDPRYGKQPPWHDAALELRGPVVADVLELFAERWNDPHPLGRRTPYRMLLQRLADMPRHPEPLPETAPPPPPAGPHAVQLLRTYGVKHPPFPFAPGGERSVAQAYTKAFSLARSLIYIEDQYLWSAEVAAGIAAALEQNPGLNVIAVVPRYPESDGPLGGPPKRLGQLRAIETISRAAPDRFGVFNLENRAGTPIYVHAKICIIDDAWFTCGSDNFNRRSWTTDGDLTCAVVDTSAGERETPGEDTGPGSSNSLAYRLRLQLWAEHLGVEESDPRLHDPGDGLALWNAAADALDEWHKTGRRPPRPKGHVRHHTTAPVTRLQRLWAAPANRHLVDPDCRPRKLRGTTRF